MFISLSNICVVVSVIFSVEVVIFALDDSVLLSEVLTSTLGLTVVYVLSYKIL